MNVILTIVAIIACVHRDYWVALFVLVAVTARETVRAVVAHAKARDAIKLIEAKREEAEVKLRAEEARKSAAIKLIEAKREEAEVKLRAEEARKSAAEMEKILQETKVELASRLSTLTEEQLIAYNRTLEEAQRPVVQYVPIQQFYPYNYGLQAWKWW